MSSSTVNQGLHSSCHEPGLMESQSLELKLVEPKSHFLRPPIWAQKSKSSDSDIEECNNDNNNNMITSDNIGDNASNDNNSNGDFGGWNSIHALADASQRLSKEVKKDKEKPYIHPLDKHSWPKLSQVSLDLCTENLGCETGTNIGNDIDIDIVSHSSDKSSTRERSKLRQISCYRKMDNECYPPPLTSITGSNCVRIRSHREDGRLVMKAVVVPSSNTIFQAERIDGCLKLRLLNNYNYSSFDYEAVEEGKEKHYEDQEHVHEVDDHLDEEIDGINEVDGGELGMKDFQRPNRCMEGGRENKRILIWEPFWVPIS